MQTILVVEDETSITDVIIAILSDEGYRVVAAGNGQEAFTRLQSEHPDLIISDVMMPVMDGRELSKRLQAHPEYSSIPLIMMSAAYGPAYLGGNLHSAFLRKPFNVQDLITTVDDIISKRSSTS